MLKQSFCGSAEMIARLGGAFCGEKLVTGFALLDRRVEIDPATFNKTALDKIIQEDKFIGKISFFNVEDNDQEADYNTSVRKERSRSIPGTKGYRFTFDKGSSFQNELAKLDNSDNYSFVPIFEDGSALFAIKANGKLMGFACKLFVGVKKLKTTSEVSGSTLEVDILPDAMIYWQKSENVFESDEFSFNEINPIIKLAVSTGVLTNTATTTKVKVTEAFSNANVTGLTDAAKWKIEEDGVIGNITNVAYDASAQEYTLTHSALATGKKVRFITSDNGLRVISLDTNYYTGESELKSVV
jgi:hypothetical protein|nr:MAG TPA: hypothetical protein [Caudoviricetes sp.]DAW80938.1 MAG TPA: hypothetical protein [Caudoviricetes sp.]